MTEPKPLTAAEIAAIGKRVGADEARAQRERLMSMKPEEVADRWDTLAAPAPLTPEQLAHPETLSEAQVADHWDQVQAAMAAREAAR